MYNKPTAALTAQFGGQTMGFKQLNVNYRPVPFPFWDTAT